MFPGEGGMSAFLADKERERERDKEKKRRPALEMSWVTI